MEKHGKANYNRAQTIEVKQAVLDRLASEEGHQRGRNFSDFNREISQQVDPDSQERVQLLTRKQFEKTLRKQLKEF